MLSLLLLMDIEVPPFAAFYVIGTAPERPNGSVI
jgi:hypothetical protein